MDDLNEGGITRFFIYLRELFLTSKTKEIDS